MVFNHSIVDGVRRAHPNGIQVIIVGAGVGGLTAALECWRKGCDVVVLERTDGLSQIGDFFTITPSALTTLHEYPSMFDEYHRHVNDCTIHMYSPSGKCLSSAVPEWNRPSIVPHAAPAVKISFLNRRSQWAEMLMNQTQRLGIPVHFNSEVVEITEFEEHVNVRAQNGLLFEGDVCIAASGIGSGIAGLEDTGLRDTTVISSGYAAGRIAWPTDALQPGSPAIRLLDGLRQQPQFRVYLADDSHLIVFLTKDYVAWVITHIADHRASESWNNTVEPKDMIQTIKGASDDWDPAVISFLEQSPARIVDWELRMRDCTETWVSSHGRILRLGDCAHAFLPTAGNGAVQAIEDAVSIAECLRTAGKADVAWATRVHNKLRFERVSILQQTGFLNREELHSVDLAALEADPSLTPGFFKIGRWVWGHDPQAYAAMNYAACLDHLREDKPFSNTNLPPGHKYTPWTVASEMKRIADGIPSTLKSNGYWGL